MGKEMITKIAIVVEGGNVQEVLTNDPSCQVTLIDYDNYPDAKIPTRFNQYQSAEIIEVKSKPAN